MSCLEHNFQCKSICHVTLWFSKSINYHKHRSWSCHNIRCCLTREVVWQDEMTEINSAGGVGVGLAVELINQMCPFLCGSILMLLLLSHWASSANDDEGEDGISCCCEWYKLFICKRSAGDGMRLDEWDDRSNAPLLLKISKLFNRFIFTTEMFSFSECLHF